MYVVMELFNFVELSWLDEMALRNVASNAVVSSLFDGISTRRIVHPLLDARSGTWNVALEHLAKWHFQCAHTTQNVNFCL